MMKKAFIDQIMFGLFIFIALMVFGATVSDEYQARQKAYKIKQITDSLALSMAKYYVNVNDDTDEAEDIADAMLDETALGRDIKDDLLYTWDLASDPNTITVTLDNYAQETFWYKFLDKASIDFGVSSQANILLGGDITSTGDLMPFAINGCDDSHLTVGSTHTFDLQGERGYVNDDYTEFYGVDVGNGCTDPAGNSHWAHFKNTIKDFYIEDGTLKVDDDLLDVDTSTGFCVPTVNSLAKEQDNDPKQISQSFANLENSGDLVGVVAYIGLIDCGSTASNLTINKFLKVEFQTNPSDTYSKVKNDYDVFQFQVEILDSTEPSGIELEY